MSYRLVLQKGEVRKFIEQAQNKLNITCNKLAYKIGLSGRTLRDWKRERFKPNSTILQKISNISGIPIPKHTVLPQYWYVTKGAKKGGLKRYKLYGPLGSRETRAKGGYMSWLKRKKNPDLWKKFTNSFSKPVRSENFAEFIGIMLGDGGLSKDQFTIYLSNHTDQVYAQFVKRLIKKLFDLTASIRIKASDNVILIRISGVNVVKYLVSEGLYVGNKVRLQVGVPGWVWKKDSYIKACIRGLIDTDGCFVIHRYTVNNKQYTYPKISFSNKSEPILDFMDKALQKLGFHPKRTCDYDVWLHNQNEVRRYLRVIGTNNYKPSVTKILEGGPDGKAQVC